MQKILMFLWILMSAVALKAISVREYIHERGMPSVINGVLDLSHSNLTNLEGLQDIPALETVTSLDLSCNKLTTLSHALFAGLSQLQELDLKGNQLSFLGSDAFAHVEQLRSLYLNHNNLTMLEEGTFTGLEQLELLGMSSNFLETLPADLFSQAARLIRLNLLSNKLSELPAGIFTRLLHLRELDLSHNTLARVPATLFEPLNQLQMLALKNNVQLHAALPDLLAYATHIQDLDLSCNKLAKLDAQLFSSLGRLERLNLSHNKLTVLPEQFFFYVQGLRILDLSYNFLSALPDNIHSLELQLFKLDVSYNYFSETSEEFRLKYLVALPRICLIFKSAEQEYAEKLQKELFAYCRAVSTDTQDILSEQNSEQNNVVQELKVILAKAHTRALSQVHYLVPACDHIGNTLIHKALVLGDPSLVYMICRLFLPLVEVANKEGRTALHNAACLPDQARACGLIQAIFAACPACACLLSLHDKQGDNVFQRALSCNNLILLEFLLSCAFGYKSAKVAYLLK